MKSEILEYQADGNVVPFKLTGYDQQLALALVQRDLDRVKDGLEAGSAAQQTEKSKFMPPLVLKELHDNLIHAYSEVEVMYDLLSKLVDTRKHVANIPQQMTLCSVSQSASDKKADLNLDLKKRHLNMTVKQSHLAKASERLRQSAASMTGILDREVDLFQNRIFQLRDEGWILHMWKGQLCVKYGPAADHCVPVDQIHGDISPVHVNKRLVCVWKFNNIAIEKIFANLMHKSDDMQDVAMETGDVDILQEAERTVLDDVLFYRLYSDAISLKQVGMQRLASINGKKVLLPFSADISLELSMESKDVSRNSQLGQWTINSLRRIFIDELKKATQQSAGKDFGIRDESVQTVNLTVRLAQQCHLLIAYLESQAHVMNLKKKKFIVNIEGWPLNNSDSFRIHVSKANVKFAVTRLLEIPHWLLSLCNQDGSWNTSDYIGSTEELFGFIVESSSHTH